MSPAAVIVLLLQESVQPSGPRPPVPHLECGDLAGAPGTPGRECQRQEQPGWGTSGRSGYVVMLAAAMPAYVGVHLVLCFLRSRRGRGRVPSTPLPQQPPAQPKRNKWVPKHWCYLSGKVSCTPANWVLQLHRTRRAARYRIEGQDGTQTPHPSNFAKRTPCKYKIAVTFRPQHVLLPVWNRKNTTVLFPC